MKKIWDKYWWLMLFEAAAAAQTSVRWMKETIRERFSNMHACCDGWLLFHILCNEMHLNPLRSSAFGQKASLEFIIKIISQLLFISEWDIDNNDENNRWNKTPHVFSMYSVCLRWDVRNNNNRWTSLTNEKY